MADDGATTGTTECGVSFRLAREADFSALDDEQKAKEHREKLTSFLLTSLQMQNLMVFAGSGTSLACGYPSMRDFWKYARGRCGFFEVARSVGQPEADENVENLLSRCEAALYVDDSRDDVRALRDDVRRKIHHDCGEDAHLQKLDVHRTFLMKLARRRARDARLKLFTTNYDRCFEVAAGKASIVPIDGFSFTHPRRFDPRFFEYDLVRKDRGGEATSFVPGVFQYFKLHGSVDWKVLDGNTVIEPGVAPDEAALIYPARAKYQHAFEQPHLELMAQYLATLRQPNTCLLVVGFGFADDHLVRPMLSALDTNPHFRMIVVDPEAELNLIDGAKPHWLALAGRAPRADVNFIGTGFEQLVSLIPDLRALSPAEQLAAAVTNVVKP